MKAKSITQGAPHPRGRTPICRNTSPMRFGDFKGEATQGKVPGGMKEHKVLSFFFPDSSDFINFLPKP